MQAKSVAAERGWAWFVDGWRLFARHMLVWVLLGLIFLFIMFASLLIPFIGQLLFMFASPILGAGLLHAARESDTNRAPRVTDLWEGFRRPRARDRLLILAAVSLAAAFVTALLMALFMRDAMMGVMGQSDGTMPMMTPGFWLRLVIVLTPQLVVAMALLYAVPLVMFRDTPVGVALQSSLEASVRNLIPLLIFGVVYTVAAIVASIPLGIGWLVLLPASVGMLYSSYKDLYEPRDDLASARQG